ncbi:hypothetical protein [Deinococcus cavernae]|uniref:hypothetical protein n=1 Tax=Deinococcus cavernae TaxID=2320857 RepID=UPI001F2133FF|nr:hypothetical protein [Deinococcus cavernae]
MTDPFFAALNAEERLAQAAQALALGYPDVAARWSADPLVQAAAYLRLGQPLQALAVLPETQEARAAVLEARASWQLQRSDAGPLAENARRLARQAGDAGAIVAGAALLGEMHLPEPRQALRTLAEGLKVAEIISEPADVYLLAVLAHAQARSGGLAKARQTAQKAYSRSPERSPARVVALLALRCPRDADEVAAAGKLGAVWFRPFISAEP